MKLARQRDRFDELGVRVVAISSDPAKDSRALRERLGLTFPLLRDEGVAVAEAYGVADAHNGDIAVPSTFIVLPTREVFWMYVGERPPDRPGRDEVMVQLEAALATSDSAAGAEPG